jgi:hypothetical protein
LHFFFDADVIHNCFGKSGSTYWKTANTCTTTIQCIFVTYDSYNANIWWQSVSKWHAMKYTILKSSIIMYYRQTQLQWVLYIDTCYQLLIFWCFRWKLSFHTKSISQTYIRILYNLCNRAWTYDANWNKKEKRNP